jgi:ankyrin repeat protein
MGYISHFPAQEMEGRIPSMPFGEVVRQLRRMNAANFGGLAACSKDLRAAGAPHGRTYQLLQARLFVTMPGALLFIGQTESSQTLACARRVLNRIEDRDSVGATVLMRAAQNGALEKVTTLLSHGADVHAVLGLSGFGQSALMLAACRGHHPVIQCLIQAGARVNETCDHGKTPLIYAAMHGQTKVVETLIGAKADVNAQDKHRWNALMFAVHNYHGHSAMINSLIDARADLNARGPYDRTALMIATHQDAEKLLLAAGAEHLQETAQSIAIRLLVAGSRAQQGQGQNVNGQNILQRLWTAIKTR